MAQEAGYSAQAQSLIPPMTDIVSPASLPAASAAGRSFNELPLSPGMQATLLQLEYLTMTPIQAASLPLALAGHDLIAQAKTGSG